MKLCAASDVVIRGVKTAAQTLATMPWHAMHRMGAGQRQNMQIAGLRWRESDLIIHLESQLHWNL